MIEAIFISDLHLSPHEPLITARFERFIHWAAQRTRSLYILGDLFHVWSGDDLIEPWSLAIAEQLAWLASSGVAVYFMPGNRDFLVGQRFAALASLTILPDPYCLIVGQTPVLLTHGDRYCTNDKGHQWLRRFTRNRWFAPLFFYVPKSIRQKMVMQARSRSQSNRSKPEAAFAIVVPQMLKHLETYQVSLVVHGHIHKPGQHTHGLQTTVYEQYVLSDWDDNPTILCYDQSKKFYFKLFLGV